MAVLLSRFPLVTETFILREVIEMERQGQPVRLVPLLRESPATVHREALPWVRAALYTPMLSAAILAANARALRRAPARYARLLARVLLGSVSSPNLFVRTLALFPKSVYLAERLREEGVAHVHAHFATHPAMAALVVSALTGIPYSVTVHAHDVFVRRALLHAKLAAASLVRTISRFNRDFLAALYPDLAGRLEVIHAGIDPESYAGPPPPLAAVPQLLCVAALKPYKGLPVLVEACRLLRNEGVDFRCDIVGEGPERAALEAAILRARLQDRVRLLGAQPQHEVRRLLAGSTLFVLPSVLAADGQMEGIPVALMEAMAAGRPVVASALSGIPELVDDGASGVLVPPEDAGRLAGAIRALLADPAHARRMGERAKETVGRDFRLDRVVSRLLDRIGVATAEGPLAARLAAHWPGRPARSLGLRRVHDGRDSAVAELLVPNGSPREVVFKMHKVVRGQSAPPAERARREFETLGRLQAAFAGEPGFGVPRPLHLAGDAVIMEACDGDALEMLVRPARWRDLAARRAAAAAVGRAGTWLRLLQRATANGGSADAALDRIVAAARSQLQACAEEGRPLADRIRRRIEELALEARSAAGPIVGRHGDFGPGNVYVSDRRVQVIDFEGFGEGLPAEDAAAFLVDLELLHAYPGLAGVHASVRAAFRDGYGGEFLDGPAHRLCRLASLIQAWLRPLPGGSGVRGLWRRRALRRLLLSA